MIGEFGSSQKESEAVLSCKELMACGASAPAVHANLLCELTSLYKDEAQFAEKRAEWLQVRSATNNTRYDCTNLLEATSACGCN